MKSFSKAGLEKLRAKAKKKHKGRKAYNSRRVQYNGVWYDSLGECNGFKRRELLEKAGEIFNLEYHRETYRLEVNGVLIAKYTPDYWYHDKNANLIIEDFKPRPKTPAQKKYLEGTASFVRFRVNQKLMKAIHGIDVQVVYV